MGEEKRSWDDIPSLEKLEVDWEYEADEQFGQRAYSRMTAEELSLLFSLKSSRIPVRVTTGKDQLTAYLLDLSQGGMRLKTKKAELNDNELIKVGFALGPKRFISKGRIRNITHQENSISFGIEFVGLDTDDDKFISVLYSSVRLPL